MPASDSDASSLYTLSDSIRNSLYRLQGERRAQAANEDYRWPCDSAAARLELTIAAMCGKLYENGLYGEPEKGDMEKVLSSAQDGPARVLDLGCGSTVTWLISMAERFPEVEFIGVDLIPADLSYLPPNLSTEVHDLLEGLPYPDNFFNLVHARASIAASFFDASYALLPAIARILRPAGVLLLEELEHANHPFFARDPESPHLGLIIARHNLRLDRIAASRPQHLHRMTFGARMADEVRATKAFGEEDGEEKVVEKIYEVPIGYTPGQGPPASQIGSYIRAMMLDMWEMSSVAVGLTEELIASLREVDEVAMPEVDVGLYVRLRTVWATKGGSNTD